MKATIDITYHKIDEGKLEELDMNYITHSTKFGWRESTREDIMCFWEEMLLSLVEDKLEYDVVYNTIFEVDISYTKDYWGEVDMDWEAVMIDHGVVGKITGAGIEYCYRDDDNGLVDLGVLKL